jgi:hypothetical protein
VLKDADTTDVIENVDAGTEVGFICYFYLPCHQDIFTRFLDEVEFVEAMPSATPAMVFSCSTLYFLTITLPLPPL